MSIVEKLKELLKTKSKEEIQAAWDAAGEATKDVKGPKVSDFIESIKIANTEKPIMCVRMKADTNRMEANEIRHRLNRLLDEAYHVLVLVGDDNDIEFINAKFEETGKYLFTQYEVQTILSEIEEALNNEEK
ncbi:gp78 [Sphingomonas phage PAU]|uniref:gp78 n=1 Tax=Sphingomonas phage PAU TaxID=1150991 RepID=UPI00025731D8|nr:gp78 [Sphingomonas phage PAU]AFF28076.1 gp78 [Sphingomonas phage PAU]